MSTHDESVACPNCHVSDQTDVANRHISNDEDGRADYTHCKLCNFFGLSPQSTDRYYHKSQFLGDDVPIEDVPARARALMIEDGYTDEHIDENVESWIDPEWLEWHGSDEHKSLAVGKGSAV